MASPPSSHSRADECVHCGILITQRVGGIPICDDCYAIQGSCCHEAAERPGFSSPPCYAHLFEEDDPTGDHKNRRRP